MDSPTKKRRFVKNENKMQTNEYVREYQLPQQLLGATLQEVIINPVESSPSTSPENVTQLSNVKSQVPYNLQKLRIISPNGKDLGEFNVHLGINNSLTNQTIIITKPDNLSSVKKPDTIPSSLVSQKRIFPRILKKSTVNMLKNNITSTYKKNNTETNKINMIQQCITLPINEIIRKQQIEVRNKEAQPCNNDINFEIPVSMNKMNPKQFLLQTINNDQKHIVYNGIKNVHKYKKTPVITIAKDGEIITTAEISPCEEIKSSLPVVNLNALQINFNDSNNIHRSEKDFKNTVSPQEYNTTISSTDEKNIINIHQDKVLHDTKAENTQNQHVPKESSDGKPNDCSDVTVNNHVDCISESQQMINTTNVIQLDVQNKNNPKDLIQPGSLDQWNIIKKAMDSVKDNELRSLALKALADCGIGIKRHVPICLPEKHKAVHDTPVQTMVFGLLDPKSFVYTNKDLGNIQRINQIILEDIPINQEQSLTNGLQSNDSPPKAPLTIEQENDFDIDNFIKQIFEENLDAVKMQETLSETKIRCKNLIEHLERDFKSVKCYDQNGMLNIHNAVVSNNIHLVQRQIMILQQCKESIDIYTKDGVTSLELAIKYDICSEIVKLLLKAGAQPVISKYLHESALIIASKQSSPLLPMLLDHISDSKLLNEIDSEGFAALHYCSMRGNVQGVKALLSAGATIDFKDMRSGRTPLFHAMDNDHVMLGQMLLKSGALAHATNYAGQTPLPIMTEKINFQNLN